jgi:hypothetical protein
VTPPAVLLSSRIHWDAPTYWRETLAWMTNVITADNDTEQRSSLRNKPRRTIEYTAKAVNAREAALLGNLVWGNQPTLMGIPVWADVCTLTAPIAAAATAATLDTTYGGTVDREFVAAGYVGFWTDPFTWEIQTLSSVTPPGSIAMSATTDAWPAGTSVFPVTLGYLNPVENQRRKSGAVNEIAIVAACDVLADTAMVAAATWSGSQFNGADCLQVPFHNWAEDPATAYHRTMLLEDSGTGIFAYYNPNAAPVPVRDFLWTNLTRPAIAQLKGFLANRLGRMNTFYCPTWVQDFVLSSAVLTTDTTLTVQSCGYSAYVFPADAVRRNLVLMTPLAFVPVTVNRAVDNGNGTETLTLNAAVGTAFASGMATMVSYLTPCRLDSDAVVTEYKTGGVSNTRLRLAEVPIGPATTVGPSPGGGGGGGSGGSGGGAGAGNMVVLQRGRYLVAPGITALGGVPAVWMRIRLLVDTIASDVALMSINGTGGTTLDVACSTVGANVLFQGTFVNGVANFDLFTIPLAALPSDGTGLVLSAYYIAAVSTWGAAGVRLETDAGVALGSFTALPGGNANIGIGNTPSGNTTVYIGQTSSAGGGGGNMTCDGGEVGVGLFAGPTSAIPTTSDVGVEGLWSFDAQSLVSVSSIGPNLVSTLGTSGAPVETYIPGGIWIAPPL